MHVSLSVSETMSYGETDILSTSEHSLLKVYATGKSMRRDYSMVDRKRS